ncbi:MAG: hypothetical protein ACAI44_05275 [Candidatus Sericytochromatia bacterium]
MTSIDGMVNGVNQFTQSMGTVMGAADSMGQAAYAVGGAVNQIAGVFTGDTYQPAPYYPAPPMPLGAYGPKAGLVGSLLAGGVAGGVMGARTADALRSFKTDGFGAGMKNLGMSSLKSGLIGAGIMGLVSGVKNMAAASRNEITKGQAGGNVVADSVGGILAGSSAGLSAGLISMAFKGGGVLGTVAAVAAGALGATGVNMLYEGSGLRDKIASSIAGTGQPNGNAYGYYQNQPQAYPQQYGYGY